MMPKQKISNRVHAESGNAVVFVLVALVVVAVGALSYFSGAFSPTDSGKADMAQSASESQPAAGEGDEGQTKKMADADDGAVTDAQDAHLTIEPGNPVVAKVAGQEVKRADVIGFIQTLPANVQQLPPEQLFPLATEQVVNAKIIGEKVKGVKLDNDPVVKAQLAAAKDRIVRTVFMQKEIEKAMTEDRLKAAYTEYKKNFPKIEEIKARHILVKDEALAKDLIKKINAGGDFAALAKEYSIDATKDNGGQLNYFSEKDVVPEFAKAAFSQKIGEISKAPVKSDFGYHIVEVQDKRQRQPATYEQAKPFLAGQLQNAVLNEIVQKWRSKANVEIFDINGNAIEPAAGE